MTISLTVTIDRSSLGKADLVISAGQDTTIGLARYSPPDTVARVTYMPDNPNIDGSEAIGASWQQAMLGFNALFDQATSEADIASGVAELCEAVGQFSYLVTTQVGNAPAEKWSADRGSVTLANSDGRAFEDLLHLDPVYSVTIPVYPIPS